MIIHFYKYQGTGNDFIIIDNRDELFPKSDVDLIAGLCHRRTGIGADGLILLENATDADFNMIYFNADGREGSMCGNGGRCIVAFAKKLGIISGEALFSASDGLHKAVLEGDEVVLKMQDVHSIREKSDYLFLNTGSPHHVQIVEELQDFEVKKEGRRLRYGLYGEKGSNINFVQPNGSNTFAVRTYERGVEDETLSCGTGVTAVALGMHYLGHATDEKVNIRTPGGTLEVTFRPKDDHYLEVYLKGPVKEVYKGSVEC